MIRPAMRWIVGGRRFSKLGSRQRMRPGGDLLSSEAAALFRMAANAGLGVKDFSGSSA